MSCYQRAMLRRQMAHALRALGGAEWVVRRDEKDLNGIPTGETVTVCSLLGVRYTKASQIASLAMDIPGVTAGGGRAPRFIGIASGGAPQAGDWIARADGTGREHVLTAEEYLDVTYMTLAGDDA